MTYVTVMPTYADHDAPACAACRRLWHSPLLVLFVAIALHLQGCEPDEVRDPLLRVMMFSAIQDTMHILC